MTTEPTLEIDGNDHTEELQDQSLQVQFSTADVTLIDPDPWPVLGDTLEIDVPAWEGTINAIEERYGVKKDAGKLFVKITAKRVGGLEDLGPAPFDVSEEADTETDPPRVTWVIGTLVVNRRQRDDGAGGD